MTDPDRRTLYHGGPILGLDHAEDVDQALLVEGTRIRGRGDLSDMRTLAGGDAEEVDLDGACLLPGIIDSHPHAMHFMAYRVGAVDILDASSFDDIVAAIRARAAVTPKGEWIVCTPVGEPHYFLRRDFTSLAERRMPDRRVLDSAAPEHPVWIMAWAPKTPNVTSFNSLALARLGIGPQIPDQVCEVIFEKDAAGLPSGVLRGKVNNYYGDDPYWAALSARLPTLPDAVWELAGVGGLQACNALGVTGFYEAHAMMPPHLDAYQAIADKGLCTGRVVTSLELSGYAFSTMNFHEADVWGLLEHGAARVALEHDRYRINGVTLSRGGPLSQGYLRMHEPYMGPYGPTRGKTFLSQSVEREVIRTCLDRNLRLNMVLGGYRDHDEFIESLRAVADADEVASRDWVLQHCYFTSPAQIAAYREYDFHITTSASFVYGKSKRVADKFPPAVAEDFIAMRRFVEAGLNLACGTDWGPDNPWLQMALNETREDAATGRRDMLPGRNGIDRLTSLQAFTRNAARVMQWRDIGRLDAGALADLVVVDRNPLTADAAALAETQVLRTVLDGAAIFDTGAISGGPLAIPASVQTIASGP
jgi:predicted amidohydrolase YtcJ